MSLLFSLLLFAFRFSVCWIACIWCGGLFPFWGTASYGPRKAWQCKYCGRQW